jgi:hypothetical protein
MQNTIIRDRLQGSREPWRPSCIRILKPKWSRRCDGCQAKGIVVYNDVISRELEYCEAYTYRPPNCLGFFASFSFMRDTFLYEYAEAEKCFML